MTFHVPEQYRLRAGRLATRPSDGNNGCFLIPSGFRRPYEIRCIASDGRDWEAEGFQFPAWEHVSVSTAVRCPLWDEMSFVKDLFWDSEDCVMQLHPPRSEWVNNHPYCLHLWRPIGIEILRPPTITVGIL